MEGEDEEFEKLLGEIPQAMEGTPELDDPESASSNSSLFFPEEGGHTEQFRSSTQSVHGLIQNPPANPDFVYFDADFHPVQSDGVVNANTFVGLHPARQFLDAQVRTTESICKRAPQDASLTAAFANLELEMGNHVHQRTNLAFDPLSEGFVDTQHKVNSMWASNQSSFGSISRCSRSVMHATADGFALDAPTNGANRHPHGAVVGLGHRGMLLPQCGSGKNSTASKGLSIDRDTDCLHQVFGVRVIPDQPFKYQVPVPCSAENGVAKLSIDRKGSCWQYDSEMVACLQAQKLHKLKLLQQERGEGRIDQLLAHWEECPQNSVGVQFSNDPSAFCTGRDPRFFHPMMIGGGFSPRNCGGHLEQKFINPCTDGFCMCTQDLCGKGDDDHSSLQVKSRNAAGNKAFQVSSAFLSNNSLRPPNAALYGEKAQVRILSRKSSRVAAAPVSAPLPGWGLNDANASIHKESRGSKHYSTALGQENSIKSSCQSRKVCQITDLMQQGPSFSSLAEIEGRIVSVAKDQHGCRFLQGKFDEGATEDVQKIFSEILDYAADLMVDPFGNYLIQKLFEVCTDNQRLDLLQSVTTKRGLVNVSLNMHGTRAVQKLIETLKSTQQVEIVISSLRSGVVTLIKDLHGNHVIQRCLQHLSNEDNEFIFEAAAHNCVEIATHRHGCCVLQRCIDHSAGVPRQNIIREVASNSLQLSQDSFGNYVVQYVLELGYPWAVREVTARLVENYSRLSMQKFSSNVVEKCLKLSEEESRACIVQELIDSSHLLQLLQDPYANYVIQSALMVSKGPLHISLVEAIRPHIPSLRNSPYGKRILSHRSLRRF